MSHVMIFGPMSIRALFALKVIEVLAVKGEIKVFLRFNNGEESRNIHIYSNSINGHDFYGLASGYFPPDVELDCIARGSISSLEINYYHSDALWGFESLKIRSSDNSYLLLKIDRYSFPEPALQLG